MLRVNKLGILISKFCISDKIKYLITIVLLLKSNFIVSQSILLRPGIGITFSSTKIDKSLSNDLDMTFKGRSSQSKLNANIVLELMTNKFNIELGFNSIQYGNYSFTHFKSNDIDIIKEHKEYGSIRQFNLVLSKNFEIKKNAKPYLGFGFGLGINRPKSFFDSSYYSDIVYSIANPNEYLKYDQGDKKLNNLAYSILLRLGVSVFKENKEKMRIYGEFNFGLNKFVQTDVIYYHTTKKYFATTTSKGNQFALRVSLPLYLKRWQK